MIEQMTSRHESRPEMQWIEMDVLDLQFGEEFDLVIDKGGSITPTVRAYDLADVSTH